MKPEMLKNEANGARYMCIALKHEVGDYNVIETRNELLEPYITSDGSEVEVFSNQPLAMANKDIENATLFLVKSATYDGQCERIIEEFKKGLVINDKKFSIITHKSTGKEVIEFINTVLTQFNSSDTEESKVVFSPAVSTILSFAGYEYDEIVSITNESDTFNIISLTGEPGQDPIREEVIQVNKDITDNADLGDATNTETHSSIDSMTLLALRTLAGINADDSSEVIKTKLEALFTKAATEPVEGSIEISEEPEEVIEEPEITDEGEIECAMAFETLKDVTGKNKMHSDRALTLVKDVNKRWLKDIFPNLMHKLENIEFFKNNIDKFKLDPNAPIEDNVAKVASGVVHVEILKKNLSKWNNSDPDWKDSANKQIKYHNKEWKKEVKSFKESFMDALLPLIKGLLAIDEEPELIEDEDSIDLVIVNEKEPKESHSTEQEEEEHEEIEVASANNAGTPKDNIGMESQEEETNENKNIYNRMSFNEIKSKSNSENELINNIFMNKDNVEDFDKIVELASKYELFGMESLDDTSSLKELSRIDIIKRGIMIKNLSL
ncbi:MAG: hypothetical protein ACRC92_20620 [Peptostreptococcaceae bacterium]